jgi:hypothetical protein
VLGIVAISDEQFRASVIGGGILLALGIAAVRFCGSVSLPPKPVASPPEVTGTSSDLLSASASSPAMYLDLLARDAQAAGLAKPTIEEMSRKFSHRVDVGRHVLEVGQRPIALAGLELSAVQAGESLGLEIRNTTRFDLAYLVISAPAPDLDCSGARPLPLNVMVIGAQQRETRVECVWRDDVAITIARVETIELSPLSARYVSQVPPEVVGIEDRIARGHRVEPSGERCPSIVPQAVRTGLERGEIGWRDLIDFYARHRCQTYQFPLTYRAFNANGAQRLPIAGAGH